MIPTRTIRLLPLLLLAVLLAHGTALVAPLQFDDYNQIVNNPQLKDPGNLAAVFFDPWIGFPSRKSSSYRPLLYASFILEHQVAGGAPWPYRVVSLVSLLLLAVAAGGFAVRLLERLMPTAAADRLAAAGAMTALLAAVHPLYNQAVLLASARASLWMGLFGLLALGGLLAPGKRGWGRTLAIVAATSAALLSKESGVILAPLAVLLCLLFGERRQALARLLASWPVLVPVALYLLLHQLVVAGAWVDDPPPLLPGIYHKVVGPWLYPAQGGIALLQLLRLALLPWGLSPVHPVFTPIGIEVAIGYGAWIAALLLALAGWWRGGGWRLAGFALGWFALAMALPLALVVLNTPQGEHRTVLALVPLLACVAWWITSPKHTPAWRRVLPVLLPVVLAAAAAVQSWPWHAPLALWSWQTRIEPQSFRAWAFLSYARQDNGDIAGALEAVEQALTRVEQPQPLLLGHAADLAIKAGDHAAANRLVDQALAIDDQVGSLHSLKARLLAGEHAYAEAQRHAERAVTLSPTLPGAWVSLGNVKLMKGDRQGAASAYQRALEIDPGHRAAATNMRRLQPPAPPPPALPSTR